MRNHQTACILLVVVILGILYGINELRNATNVARNAASAAQLEAEGAEQRAQIAQIQLKTLDSKTSELRQAYEEWKPHFHPFRTAQDAEQRVAELIRNGDIFLISQRFESKEIDRDGLIPQALVGDLVLEDEYAKTLNWLGRLEEALPSCRITRCNLTRGDRGNDIHLEVQIQIPILRS